MNLGTDINSTNHLNISNPLLVSSLVFLITLGIHVSIGHTYWYFWFIWNLLLAVLPNLFSYLSRSKNISTNSIYKFLLLFSWLLFFSNSIYLLTDVIHLVPRQAVFSYWFDSAMFFSLFSVGIISSFVSLKSVLSFHFFEALNSKIKFYSASSLLWFLTFVGVYIGRDIRVNSWDILNPLNLITKIIFFDHQLKNIIPFLLVWPLLISIAFFVWIENTSKPK